jgi:hypothetical protein
MEREKKRKYFGTVLAESAYAGKKALSVSFEPDSAIDLAQRLLAAWKEGKVIDLTIWWGKKRKDGKVSVTVTTPIDTGGLKQEPKRPHQRMRRLPAFRSWDILPIRAILAGDEEDMP